MGENKAATSSMRAVREEEAVDGDTVRGVPLPPAHINREAEKAIQNIRRSADFQLFGMEQLAADRTLRDRLFSIGARPRAHGLRRAHQGGVDGCRSHLAYANEPKCLEFCCYSY